VIKNRTNRHPYNLKFINKKLKELSPPREISPELIKVRFDL